MEIKQIIHWISGLLLIALILGFGYHLYTFSSNSASLEKEMTSFSEREKIIGTESYFK